MQLLPRLPTVVDFGAGAGTWLEAAVQYGAETALAIEGEWVRSSVHRFAGAHYRYQDLNDPIRIDQRFDLAIRVEVAERFAIAARSVLRRRPMSRERLRW